MNNNVHAVAPLALSHHHSGLRDVFDFHEARKPLELLIAEGGNQLDPAQGARFEIAGRCGAVLSWWWLAHFALKEKLELRDIRRSLPLACCGHENPGAGGDSAALDPGNQRRQFQWAMGGEITAPN